MLQKSRQEFYPWSSLYSLNTRKVLASQLRIPSPCMSSHIVWFLFFFLLIRLQFGNTVFENWVPRFLNLYLRCLPICATQNVFLQQVKSNVNSTSSNMSKSLCIWGAWISVGKMRCPRTCLCFSITEFSLCVSSHAAGWETLSLT